MLIEATDPKAAAKDARVVCLYLNNVGVSCRDYVLSKDAEDMRLSHGKGIWLAQRGNTHSYPKAYRDGFPLRWIEPSEFRIGVVHKGNSYGIFKKFLGEI